MMTLQLYAVDVMQIRGTWGFCSVFPFLLFCRCNELIAEYFLTNS